MIARLILAGLLAFTAAPALAETLAIVGARVVTLGPAGDLPSATVVVRDGKIAAVGTGAAAPAGARIIDGHGLVLTPGLVATVTPLALNDTIGSGYGGLGSRNPRLSAAFDVLPDVNPASPQIPEARIEGVTRAIVAPNPPGGPSGEAYRIFGGLAGLITLGEGQGPALAPALAVVSGAGSGGAAAAGGSRGAWRTLLDQSMALARDAQRAPERVSAERLAELSLSRADLAALVPVAAGRRPLLVEVNRASDIRNVLAAAEANRIRVVLSGAAEAWMVADEIARARVPVILDAEDNQAFTFESLNANYRNAAILHEAGVLVAFKPGIARIVFQIRTPRFLAGRTVPFGLPWEEALKAITLNPARIFGFADRSGSIETGKDADLVLWSGDPLETTTVARLVIIGGEIQPATARNRLLRDRYLGDVRPVP